MSTIVVDTDLSSAQGGVQVAAGAANARVRAHGKIVLKEVEGAQCLTFVPDSSDEFAAVQAA